jgi:hypothetical protein
MSVVLKSVAAAGALAAGLYWSGWYAFLSDLTQPRPDVRVSSETHEEMIKRIKAEGAAFKASEGGKVVASWIKTNKSKADTKIKALAGVCLDGFWGDDLMGYQKTMISFGASQLAQVIITGKSPSPEQTAEAMGEIVQSQLGEIQAAMQSASTRDIQTGQAAQQQLMTQPTLMLTCIGDAALKEVANESEG